MTDDLIETRVGESFEVALEGQPTAGYRWRAVLPPGARARLEPIGQTTEARGSQLGAPAIQRFRFRALEPGTVTLDFHYGRHWETEPDPDRRRFLVRIAAS
jgi:predicted secreted protein